MLVIQKKLPIFAPVYAKKRILLCFATKNNGLYSKKNG